MQSPPLSHGEGMNFGCFSKYILTVFVGRAYYYEAILKMYPNLDQLRENDPGLLT